MSNVVDFSGMQFTAWNGRDRQIQQVAAAIHRMNNEPGMAENPVWRELCEAFDRRHNGLTYWELPF